MPNYKAPTRDMQFVAHELFDFEKQLSVLPDFEEATADIVDAVIDEASKLIETEIFPLNKSGDEEECHFENGVVTTPKGFKEAFAEYVESGWNSLSISPDFGGQGLPATLHSFVEEMLCSGGTSFSLYPCLTNGAIHAISNFASDELKELYLPKMVEGVWTGAMDMTEDGAGSDLGLIKTRAVPNGDGTYSITGSKIFITAGDHDLSQNVVHLVLAKLPDAPKGTRGISMFLVPKLLPDANGDAGEKNNVTVGAIEHKMGIKGSATCVMNYDASKGWLVGEENKGLKAMFSMMNTERLFVGLQSLGLSEVAYQNAVEYARERIQGRSPLGAKSADKSADSILVHPNVKDDLLFARSFVEAARALNAYTFINLDKSRKCEDAQEKQKSDDMVALLTPVIKAGFSDFAYEATTRCQGVLGGHGYIREWGLEQYVRDCRITQIYEGTNQIQSYDLTGRKIGLHEGRLVNAYFAEIEEFIAQNADLEGFVSPLSKYFEKLKNITKWLLEEMPKDRALLGSCAVAYLHIFALVSFAYMWAKMAKVAMPKVGENSFYANKVKVGKYFMSRVLPRVLSLEEIVKSGSDEIMEMNEDDF
jgi:alkylation response protein AidB-like acyl-CoA dehydrogenase